MARLVSQISKESKKCLARSISGQFSQVQHPNWLHLGLRCSFNVSASTVYIKWTYQSYSFSSAGEKEKLVVMAKYHLSILSEQPVKRVSGGRHLKASANWPAPDEGRGRFGVQLNNWKFWAKRWLMTMFKVMVIMAGMDDYWMKG